MGQSTLAAAFSHLAVGDTMAVERDIAPLGSAFEAYQRVRFGEHPWNESSRRSLRAGLHAARAMAAAHRRRR